MVAKVGWHKWTGLWNRSCGNYAVFAHARCLLATWICLPGSQDLSRPSFWLMRRLQKNMLRIFPVRDNVSIFLVHDSVVVLSSCCLRAWRSGWVLVFRLRQYPLWSFQLSLGLGYGCICLHLLLFCKVDDSTVFCTMLVNCGEDWKCSTFLQ